jgi:hypothetical protein
MNNIETMITALRTDKASEAQTAFASAMAEKVNAALDQQKIAVAGQIYNKAIQPSP